MPPRGAGPAALRAPSWCTCSATPAAPEDVDDGLRVGFVVSKAVGNAVVRNRVRRRLRHLVRDRLDVLPHDGVLVVRSLPAAATASSAQLAGDLDRCLQRVTA